MFLRPLVIICVLALSFSSLACVQQAFEFEPQEDSEIRLSRGGGLGYCVSTGDIVSVRITNISGVQEMEGAFIRAGDPEVDDCIEDDGYYVQDADCLTRQEVEPVRITAEDYRGIREALADIPQKECVEDPDRICHPCLITSLTVDDHRVSRDCCGELNSDFSDAFQRAVGLFEDVFRSQELWELE